MKILFIDSKDIKNSIRISLLENMAHHSVVLVDNYEDALITYKDQRPQMVLIDFETDFGSKALADILKINQNQHIITISSSPDCSESIGCEFCQQNYQKRRILKSEGIHALLQVVDDFQYMGCAYANKLNNPNDKPVS